ncbi:histidine phosphatase family protein [Candidatus Parcubacteria bacterium]|nr:MAG: histidine phosphatase family protein [Candidatus Parcubacteria bacterium]
MPYTSNMKWPTTLIFIRHGESAFNALREKKRHIENYEKFRDLFSEEFSKATTPDWPSKKLINMANEIWKECRLDENDYDTPLTEIGRKQARITGEHLANQSYIPDVVFVSPYLRTRQTLEEIQKGWPALRDVRVVSEERIREQEHGLSTLYNDRSVYFTLNPLQGLLYKLEGDYGYKYPNGENKANVRDRVRSFLSTTIREYPEKTVLSISHHLTLLSLRANLERWDREQFIKVDSHDHPINCGVTIYKGNPKKGQSGRLELESYNQKLY